MEEIGGDTAGSDWVTGQDCSTTISERFQAAQQNSETKAARNLPKAIFTRLYRDLNRIQEGFVGITGKDRRTGWRTTSTTVRPWGGGTKSKKQSISAHISKPWEKMMYYLFYLN